MRISLIYLEILILWKRQGDKAASRVLLCEYRMYIGGLVTWDESHE